MDIIASAIQTLSHDMAVPAWVAGLGLAILAFYGLAASAMVLTPLVRRLRRA